MYAVRHESLQDAIVRIDSKAIYAQTMATLGRFGILENCTRDEESQSAFESTDIYSAGSTMSWTMWEKLACGASLSCHCRDLPQRNKSHWDLLWMAERQLILKAQARTIADSLAGLLGHGACVYCQQPPARSA